MSRAAAVAWLVALVIAGTARSICADAVAGLAPADDARRSTVIGVHGAVYEGDGAGSWVRRSRLTTATELSVVGVAGTSVIAHGGGVAYRLSVTGWSAYRLAQSGAVVMGSGRAAVGAVGTQIFALDRFVAGEPAKLGRAAAPIRQLAAGCGDARKCDERTTRVIAVTASGLYRFERAAATKIAGPSDARWLDDRWAIVERGLFDLRAGKQVVGWPSGGKPQAALATANRIAVVGQLASGLELWVVDGRTTPPRLDRTPIKDASGTAVGVVVDSRDRAVIALADGTIWWRDGVAWATATIRDELPPDRPGPPPAASH